MRISILFILLFVLLAPESAEAQNKRFTRQDTLRGSITSERAWWDLLHYDLSVRIEPVKKFISGTNIITYQVLDSARRMQIDLQPPMRITRVEQNGTELEVEKDGNAWFVSLQAAQDSGSTQKVAIHFEGKPEVSKLPPWDGGFTWKKDRAGNDFIATSCQGDGASLWWPCKDHMYDEPEGLDMHVTVPEHLTDVSNGRLVGIDTNDDKTRTFHWKVVSPINNYGVNVNVGDYVHFGEQYEGEAGTLDCDYWVLRQDLDKAQEQFKQVPGMLKAFEYWFGPYPFYADGFKLVQVPYLGMEHQSSVTYGNRFKNGYLGSDLSGSGWGLKFDFIIIHESGHEWFANSITNIDIADMWVHEGFTAYSENLYLDYHYGTQASNEYVVGTRKRIRNDKPIIGPYGVNEEGSGDMYYKGANALHMLRQITGNDERWRDILRNLCAEFRHQTVSSKQVENYLSAQMKRDLQPFFDQYLRDVRIPILEYRVEDEKLAFKWSNSVKNFNMPVRVWIDGNTELWLEPETNWKSKVLAKSPKKVEIDPNFYIAILNVTGK